MADFPTPPPPVPATPPEACETALQDLHKGRAAWVGLSNGARAELLRACIDGVAAVQDRWVAASCAAKGYRPGDAGEGEELLAGTMPTIRNLRLFAEALDAGGQPKLGGTWQRPDGQWVARVYPTSLMDKVLLGGVTADVWIEPGHEPTQGRIYREKAEGRFGDGGLCVVLGGGNQNSIPPMDFLYKLVVDDEVCILKMNPVNEYLGPLLEDAFKPLIDGGFLRVVYGGADIGALLCEHPLTTSIHITGSAFAHDAIVFGAGEEGAQRKAENRPRLDKLITSELGCVTPTLVVPGPWSDADFEYHAANLAAMITYNAGFNCNSARVIVLPKQWDGSARLLDAFERKLRTLPQRKSYYPTGQKLWDAFATRYPDRVEVGARSETSLPWTILKGVGTGQDEYALRNEAWCGLVSVVELDGRDASEYLANAVPFANDTCWGTLSVNVLVHPKTEAEHGAAVEKAIADLRYGGVAINCWSGLNYGLVSPTWGAFPGHPLTDIQSGRGVVHNGLLLDHPQKSVVRVPFVMKPKPAWFTGHKTNKQLGLKMAAFEASPSWLKVPGVAITAFGG